MRADPLQPGSRTPSRAVLAQGCSAEDASETAKHACSLERAEQPAVRSPRWCRSNCANGRASDTGIGSRSMKHHGDRVGTCQWRTCQQVGRQAWGQTVLTTPCLSAHHTGHQWATDARRMRATDAAARLPLVTGLLQYQCVQYPARPLGRHCTQGRPFPRNGAGTPCTCAECTDGWVSWQRETPGDSA